MNQIEIYGEVKECSVNTIFLSLRQKEVLLKLPIPCNCGNDEWILEKARGMVGKAVILTGYLCSKDRAFRPCKECSNVASAHNIRCVETFIRAEDIRLFEEKGRYD